MIDEMSSLGRSCNRQKSCPELFLTQKSLFSSSLKTDQKKNKKNKKIDFGESSEIKEGV